MRTPLAVVTQGIEALLTMSDEGTEGAQRLFDVVRRNVQLMGEMLAASMNGATPIARAATLIDLEALARDVADLIKPVLDARDQRVEFDVTGRRSRARGDYGALARVILNLLDNASKYGPVGDTLRVQIRRRGAFTMVSVHDHGPGIPEGERHAIFRAFYRTDGARRSDTEGFGLGLSVVREVVGQHGGTLGVGRLRGETRVWFCLPNETAAAYA